jgi:hypothetical protein
MEDTLLYLKAKEWYEKFFGVNLDVALEMGLTSKKRVIDLYLDRKED